VDWTAAIAVDQALREQLSCRDVTRPGEMKADRESPLRLEGQPQPSLMTPNLDPRLIHQKASNTTNSEAIVQMAEALDPTPNRDIAPRTEILQAREHGSQTQTLEAHIRGVQHEPEENPLTFK